MKTTLLTFVLGACIVPICVGSTLDIVESLADIPGAHLGYSIDGGIYQDTNLAIPAENDLDEIRALEDLSGNGRNALINSLHGPAFLVKNVFGGTNKAIYFTGLASGLEFDRGGLKKDDFTIVMRLIPLTYYIGAYCALNGVAEQLYTSSVFQYQPIWQINQNSSSRSFNQMASHNANAVTIVLRVFPAGSATPGAEIRQNGTAVFVSFTPTAGTYAAGTKGMLGARETAYAPFQTADQPQELYLTDFWIYSRAITTAEAAIAEEIVSTRPGPVKIFDTSKPLVIFDGNSIMPYYEHISVRDGMGVGNHLSLAIIGGATPELNSTFNVRVLPYLDGDRAIQVAFIDELVNDRVNNPGSSDATIYGNLKALGQKYMDAGCDHVIIGTMRPNGTVTDFGLESSRIAINNLIRADFPAATGIARVTAAGGGVTWATHLIDFGNDPDFGQPGDEDDTAYYFDRAHLTSLAGNLHKDRYILPCLELCGLLLSAPTDLYVTGSGAVATWTARPGADSYTLRRAPMGTATYTTFTGIATETYDDNPGAGDYDYSVAAVNANGTGPFSRKFTIRNFGTTKGAIELTSASSQYLEILNHADFNTATSWTYGVWVKRKSGIIDNDYWSFGSKVNFGSSGWFAGAWNAAASFIWFIFDALGNNIADFTTGVSFTVGEWFYLELKWNASTEIFSVKVNNGVAQNGKQSYASSVSIPDGLANNANPFWLGRANNGPAFYANAYFGPTRFWSRCLTDAESSTVFNHDGFLRAYPLAYADIPAGILTGLVASWDWANGALVEDSTANNHDWTNNGTAVQANFPE